MTRLRAGVFGTRFHVVFCVFCASLLGTEHSRAQFRMLMKNIVFGQRPSAFIKLAMGVPSEAPRL